MENKNNTNNIEDNENNKIEIEKNKIIDNKYKQMKGLKSYKNIDDVKLREMAKQKLLAPDKDIEIASLFSDKKEILLGKKLLSKYLKDYTPTSVSDKNNLRHLIYLEMLQVRLQDKMNVVNATSNAIPLQMIDSIHKNLREINDLKLKLGLVGIKREEVRSDAYKAWELLKDKFKRWREENQGSRSLVCPYCGKMVILKIRMEMWEAGKHPYFKDRILANKHLVKLYNEGKVDRADVAAILECSEHYIDWLIDKWAKIEDKDVNNLQLRLPTEEEADESSSSAADEQELESGEIEK